MDFWQATEAGRELPWSVDGGVDSERPIDVPEAVEGYRRDLVARGRGVIALPTTLVLAGQKVAETPL